MVNDHSEGTRRTSFSLAEFCILHKYRRSGLGRWFAMQVFDRHRGTWQLKRHPGNTASVYFWDKVVSEYSGGNYEADLACAEARYDEGTSGDILYFSKK